MKRLIRYSYVEIFGKIWMPMIHAGMRKDLTSYDIENMRGEDGKITRESVDQWLACHSGDFSSVIDFSASIEDGNDTIDIPWQSENNEIAYQDCMYPSED